LWYSENATEANPSFTQLMSYDFQHPMRVFFHPQNVNEVWVSSFGNGMKVGHTEVSAVATLTDKSGFTLYPNPANGHFSITSSLNLVNFQLLDQQGNVVMKSKINGVNPTIDTHSLAPGIYFVSVQFADGLTATEKIIILPNR